MTQSVPPQLQVIPQLPAVLVSENHWRCAWSIRNVGPALITIQAAWLPHARFRAERREFPSGIALVPGQDTQLEFEVACQETAGTVVENPFVILTVESERAIWRVFARLTVHFGDQGRPEPRTELITVNPLGFSSDTMPTRA